MLKNVWTQPGWPPAELPAPENFLLTPRDAYTRLARSKKLSLKHRWFCFCDEERYFIAEAFGKDISAKTAFQHGVRVNGKTGKIE